MIKDKIKNIHFMGVGGSGISGVAMLAHAQGYQISGCDMSETTAYIEPVKKVAKDIFVGHDPKHLENIDLLVTSPAVLYLNKDHPELTEARKKAIPVMTWEDFLGQYLLENKKVICIAGTHGKSTTTAMVALLFEKAGLDPSVMIGANVKEWGVNYRIGKGKYFIVEADEFNNNFLNYHPETVVLNNIEFDHPDFFKDETAVFASFKKFLGQLVGPKNLIANVDSVGVTKLLGGSVAGYSTKNLDIKLKSFGSEFTVDDQTYHLQIPGVYNVSNALGVIAVAKLYSIKPQLVAKVLADFDGIGRRMDLLGKVNGVTVYDDYAHHPTAIKVTLEGLKQRYPKNKIWVVYEPHSYSRTKALLTDYRGVFDSVDRVIITQIYKARDTSNFGIDENSVVKAAKHKNARVITNFGEVVKEVVSNTKSRDVVIVMGAGKSYLLARDIFKSLQFASSVGKNVLVRFNESLAKHTFLKIGGPADFYVETKTTKDLLATIGQARKLNLPITMLGLGSNVLISDEGIRGVVIVNKSAEIKILGKTRAIKNEQHIVSRWESDDKVGTFKFEFKDLDYDESDKPRVKVQMDSGVDLDDATKFLLGKGITGLQWYSGIPGTVGGDVFNNIHGGTHFLSEVIDSVRVINRENKIIVLKIKDLGVNYDKSRFHESGEIILDVVFNLYLGEVEKARYVTIEWAKRKSIQPRNSPGSAFQNLTQEQRVSLGAPTTSIGFVVEHLLKIPGYRIGDAAISDKHNNFIVNMGKATAKDYLLVLKEIYNRAKKQLKVTLVPEIFLLGFKDEEIAEFRHPEQTEVRKTRSYEIKTVYKDSKKMFQK